MKSIRRSLLLYFLTLATIALAAVSGLAYRNAQTALESRTTTRADLLRKQYEENCNNERLRLDNSLMEQARILAAQAEFQWKWERAPVAGPMALSSLIGSSTLPQNLYGAQAWLPRMPQAIWPVYFRLLVAKIDFNEGLANRTPDGTTEYFQINSGSSSGSLAWHSRSMGETWFDFTPALLNSAPLLEEKFDDTEFRGVRVRRVIYKTPVARTRNPGPPRQPGPNREGGGRGGQRGGRPDRAGQSPPSSRGTEMHETLALLIQCAAETSQLGSRLAELKEGLDADLNRLHEDSARTLASLRNRFLLIGLGTFAAVWAGGIWLVRLGLSPLQRLSVAVSKVSPKDFRLPYDDAHLPRELRPIVERLTGTLAQLKRVFAREKQAAADISHDLRTPIAALLTTIEVALKKPRSSEEYREILGDLHATGIQMSKLVERLLALARLDAGVDLMRPRTFDVADLAEQCANLVRPLAEARGVTIQVHRSGAAELRADPDKLREVVTNLLHNAIEYNRPNGRVDLRVERHNGTLDVEVRDTGIGIVPEAREHIFERFFRADPSRHADEMHAGLGLAIVKGYMDLMGGAITVDSTPGEGSTFRLSLPAGAPAEEPMLTEAGRR